jgi:glucan endo-1,3-beta-D-glucosidase
MPHPSNQSGTKEDPIEAFAAAISTNTKILLGIWCSGTDSITPELNALKTAMTKYGTNFTSLVIGLSVGSEDLYRSSPTGQANNAGVGKTAADIVSFIKDARAALVGTALKSKPVGHVDSWSAWADHGNKPVLEAVDWVGTDLYPYYEKDHGNASGNMSVLFDYLYRESTNAARNSSKPVWVTETGWPVSGPDYGQAKASLNISATYWNTVGCRRLFGRVNTFWYDLLDSNPDKKEKFAISKDLSTTPLFDLGCPPGSGAPAPVNVGTKVVISSSSSAAEMVVQRTFPAGIALMVALLLL